ncbi:uncharacterized protein LOC132702640 [Cylas formicarius]|uniref:uncharacterized protein LOC132702640 n=1 Tax=Cylas formicarius TaxID=197179 RepID=UPI0029584766|nr:uncharacterized protein LOC132702640 [Cylas formicarius]
MHERRRLVFLLLAFLTEISSGTDHPRQKRYLVFPEGSSLQMIFEGTYPSVGMGNVFVFGNTAAMAYELPSTPAFLNYDKFGDAPNRTDSRHDDDDFDYGWRQNAGWRYGPEPPEIPYHRVHRRSRRELYGKIENLFQALEKHGRACLLKTICKLARLPSRKGSMVEEVLKVVFRSKPHSGYPDEDDYDVAAAPAANCDRLYLECPGSVLGGIFGK